MLLTLEVGWLRMSQGQTLHVKSPPESGGLFGIEVVDLGSRQLHKILQITALLGLSEVQRSVPPLSW